MPLRGNGRGLQGMDRNSNMNIKGLQGMDRNTNMNIKGKIGTGQKVHLRRNISKQQVIQENLSRMQQSAQKKKVAQELYYSNQGNRSPLLRANTSNYKPPVHNRLGPNQQITNINRKPVNRNQAGNRIKLRRTMVQPDQIIKNNIIRRRNDKFRRAQSVQNRILKIRNNQNQNKMSQNNQQKIRLRRMRQGPVNFTVEVSNNNHKNKRSLPQHSINLNLNSKLQEEIKIIQNKSVSQDIIPSIPIHPQGTGFTGTSLNERFSRLP